MEDSKTQKNLVEVLLKWNGSVFFSSGILVISLFAINSYNLNGGAPRDLMRGIYKDAPEKCELFTREVFTNGILGAAGFLAASKSLDQDGRGVVQFVSYMGCCLSVIGMGFGYLGSNGNFSGGILLPVLVMLHKITSYCGLATILTLLSELFPMDLKIIVATLACFVGVGVEYMGTRLQDEYISNPKVYNSSWWIPMTLVHLVCYVAYHSIPETKGETLKKIQDHFREISR